MTSSLQTESDASRQPPGPFARSKGREGANGKGVKDRKEGGDGDGERRRQGRGRGWERGQQRKRKQG